MVSASQWGSLDESQEPILSAFGGAGNGTACYSAWDGSRLRLEKGPLDGEPLGDATVPYWSSVPPEWGGTRGTAKMQRVSRRHGELSRPPAQISGGNYRGAAAPTPEERGDVSL